MLLCSYSGTPLGHGYTFEIECGGLGARLLNKLHLGMVVDITICCSSTQLIERYLFFNNRSPCNAARWKIRMTRWKDAQPEKDRSCECWIDLPDSSLDKHRSPLNKESHHFFVSSIIQKPQWNAQLTSLDNNGITHGPDSLQSALLFCARSHEPVL